MPGSHKTRDKVPYKSPGKGSVVSYLSVKTLIISLFMANAKIGSIGKHFLDIINIKLASSWCQARVYSRFFEDATAVGP